MPARPLARRRLRAARNSLHTLADKFFTNDTRGSVRRGLLGCGLLGWSLGYAIAEVIGGWMR